MNWMMKDSSGKPSATLTFAVVSLAVMIFCIVVPMFDGFTVHGFTFTVKAPDTVLLMGTLGASFLSYVNRRNTSDNLGVKEEKTSV